METAEAFTSLELNVLKGVFSVPNYRPLRVPAARFLMAILNQNGYLSDEYELL